MMCLAEYDRLHEAMPDERPESDEWLAEPVCACEGNGPVANASQCPAHGSRAAQLSLMLPLAVPPPSYVAESWETPLRCEACGESCMAHYDSRGLQVCLACV